MFDKDKEDFLVHYGTKGMRWGVRKESISPRNKSYNDQMRKEDRKDFGKRGVERINTKMNSGTERSKAVSQEDVRKMVKGIALVAALNLGPLAAMAVVNKGQRVNNKVQYATFQRQEKNGREAVAKMFSDKNGLGNYTAINVAYNAAKNVWE